MDRITKTMIARGLLAFGLFLSPSVLAHTPEDLFLFAVNWTQDGPLVNCRSEDYRVSKLLSLIATGNTSPDESILLIDRVHVSALTSGEATATLEIDGTLYERAVLVIDLDSSCDPFPPPGEDLPGDCDVFNRVFQIFLDDETQPPGFELARAVTPFGGDWRFEVDITQAANALQGTHSLQVKLGVPPAGETAPGWTVSTRLDLNWGAPQSVLAAIPLVNGVHRSDTVPANVPFETPQGTVTGFIEYRVTGHGSDGSGDCQGEEFCQRLHTILVDGETVDQFTPWRPEGGPCTLIDIGRDFEICCENPTGLPASVQFPRSNWAPGTLTPPIVVTAPRLIDPGGHTFSYDIDTVAPTGSWLVSATYYALGEPGR